MLQPFQKHNSVYKPLLSPDSKFFFASHTFHARKRKQVLRIRASNPFLPEAISPVKNHRIIKVGKDL